MFKRVFDELKRFMKASQHRIKLCVRCAQSFHCLRNVLKFVGENAVKVKGKGAYT